VEKEPAVAVAQLDEQAATFAGVEVSTVAADKGVRFHGVARLCIGQFAPGSVVL
jgi:hypothetical protein